jgi:hypothetical protein
MTDPFGQVRSRSRQLAVMVSVTVIGYMTGSCGHGHASTGERVLNSGDFIEGLPTAKELLFKIKQWKHKREATK